MELFLHCPVNPLDVHRRNFTFTRSQAVPEPLKDEGWTGHVPWRLWETSQQSEMLNKPAVVTCHVADRHRILFTVNALRIVFLRAEVAWWWCAVREWHGVVTAVSPLETSGSRMTTVGWWVRPGEAPPGAHDQILDLNTTRHRQRHKA